MKAYGATIAAALVGLALLCSQSSDERHLRSLATAKQGEEGGAWSWCTHLVKYGLNFDLGLASFLVDQLKPNSALEFGSGIGLYADYLVRYGNVEKVIALEPEDMSHAGVFVPGKQPVQLTGDILGSEERIQKIPKVDLVYSIEVAEHVPASLHDVMVNLLVTKTNKFLVFSAARPNQAGTGHIPESSKTRDEWISIFEKAGLKHLPKLSDIMRGNCNDRNANHKMNPIVFGTSAGLDQDDRSPDLKRDKPADFEGSHHEFALSLFPSVQKAIETAKTVCGKSE